MLVIVSQDCDLGKIVIRLGGFRSIISFLGCICYLLTGIGTSEALEVVYAGNTIPYMAILALKCRHLKPVIHISSNSI